MVFTPENQTVKSYVLLIQSGLKTMDDVPDIFNLRQVVQSCLEQ